MEEHDMWMLTNMSNELPPMETNYNGHTASKDITELNHEMFLLNLPGIIFVTILLIIGAIGNALVLYVYIRKIRPSNHRIFIIFLAVVDLSTSVIVMPFSIYEQIYSLMQYQKWECKMRYTIFYILLNASFIILLVIAGERYRKVCKPLHSQMSITQAKVACVIVVVISILATIPETVLFGLYTFETENPEVKGSMCYIDEAYLNTSYELAQRVYSVLLTFSTFVILSVLYYFVIHKIRRQTKKMNISGGKSAKAILCTGSAIASSDDHDRLESAVGQDATVVTTNTPLSTSNIDEEIGKGTKIGTGNGHGNVENTRASTSRRITFMLFMITVIFLISHFPFIILEALALFCSGYDENLGPIEYSVYNVFLWSLFINNMANPIIYGFCDKRFREQMKICFARGRVQSE